MRLPFNRLLSLLAFCGLLMLSNSVFATTAASAPTASTNPNALWVLGRSTLAKRALMDGSLLLNVDISYARALAVDAQTGSAWVFTAGNELKHLNPDGSIDWTLAHAVPLLSSLIGSRLLVDPNDGSVWLIGLNVAVHVDKDGREVARISTWLPINAATLDTKRHQLWLSTALKLQGYDASGVELARLDGVLPALVRALAYAPVSDAIWLATPQRLQAFQAADYTKVVDASIHSILRLAPDGAGGMWAAGILHLLRVDKNGQTQLNLSHSIHGLITGLAANPADHSVWLANLHELVKVQADGTVATPITVPFTQIPLAGLGLFVDSLPPRLSITSPADGALLAQVRPPLTLTWSDQGSGVDPNSLVFTDNLEAQAFSCQSTDTGASCIPDADLPQGTNQLSVIAKDFAGNASQAAKVSLRIDTIPPTINFTGELTPNFITNQVHALLTGVLDEVSDVAVNGAQVASNTESFSDPVTLTEGSNQFIVSATDLAGNARSVTLSGTLDTQAPTVPVAQSVSVQISNGQATLTGKAGAVEAGASVVISNRRTGQSVIVQADTNGAFTATLAAQAGDSFDVYVKDAAGNSSDTVKINSGDVPPDPASIAPPLPKVGTPPFINRIDFLYTGFYPIQKDVAPGTIVAKRAAVLAGKVMDTSGNPLPGVKISVLDHPEFGYTHSQASGNFDMAVNGGGQLTLVYTLDGYLPVQRHVQAPWQGWAHADDVAMTKLSSKVSAIDLTNTVQPFQVAQGEVEHDSDGTRQATLLFPAGETATITLADGSTKTLSQLHLRATEFTVGANGVAAMPGPLPATTAYTYAVNFTIDEASQAVEKNGSSVTFSQPVPIYVTNFLDFPVGEAVPVGYYDPDKSAWVPHANGRIIKILSIANGQAQIDVTGAGTPATPEQLAVLGITSNELSQLATLYQPGDSLWRFAVTHFSNWDCNWPYGPPSGASGPNTPLPQTPVKDAHHSDEHNACPGCEIDAQAQSMGETIPLVGTPFSLHYNSARAQGPQNNSVVIPLTGATVPTTSTGMTLLQGVKLQIDIAGRHFIRTFSGAPNQNYTFAWDGKDAFGRSLIGDLRATITVSYQYPCIYLASSGSGNGFGQYGNQSIAIGTRSRCKRFEFPRKSEVVLSPPISAQQTAGYWSLSVDHALVGESLLLGSGRGRNLQGGIIVTVAGTGERSYDGDGGLAINAGLGLPEDIAVGSDGSLYIPNSDYCVVQRVTSDGLIHTVAGSARAGYSGDGGLAVKAKLHNPAGVAVGSDGSLYIADMGNNVVRRVTPDGIIHTVAGTGVAGYSGDGGAAMEAELNGPRDIAIGSDGSLYIAEFYNNVIRRVTPDGIIHTIAGTGVAGYSGDGGAATEAQLSYPKSIAIGPNSNLYIASDRGNVIRRVASDGTISTFAGKRRFGYSGDGGLASEAKLHSPSGITVDHNGNVYITSFYNHEIRKVTADGIIRTIAGTVSVDGGYSGDGGPAIKSELSFPYGVALAPDNSLYIASYGNNVIRRIMSESLAVVFNGYRSIISKDGSRRFVFDANGNILRTENATTGAVIYTFERNFDGELLSVTDAHGKVTRIERNADGTPTSIVAPNGQSTQLTVTNGHLTGVTDPTGASWNMTYTTSGLLTSFTNRAGSTDSFSYDAKGRLISNQAPNGHGWHIVRSVLDAALGDYQVSMTSGAGNTSTFVVKHPMDGKRVYTNTAPDGSVTTRTHTDAGSTQITHPDGSTESITKGPDPRFGMAAPVIKSDVITTPAGLARTLIETRTAVVPTGGDPTQPTSLTNKITVNGHTTTSTYTGSSHTWITTSPAGRSATSVINNAGQPLSIQAGNLAPVQNQYNAQGKLASITRSADGSTRTTKLAYASSGAAAGYLQSVTGPLGLTVSYQRDANGRVTRLTRPDGQHTSFAYDAEGRLTSLTPPDGSAHVFSYDGNGSRTGYTPPAVGSAGSATVYHYNADLQPTEIERPDGKSVTLSYASGKLASLTTPLGSTHYTYNASSGQLTNITAPGGAALAYTYDGPLTTQVQWSGAVSGSVAASYNNDFAVTSQSVNGTAIPFSYDADGLLTQAGDLAITRATDVAQVTGTTLANLSTANSYNGYGELASDSASISGNTLFRETLARDLAGRIIEKTLTQNGTTVSYGYHYDSAGRLSYVTHNGVTIASYSYDANGNRTQKATPLGGSAVLNASYDAQDRLTSYGSNSYTYNAAGDLTSKVTLQGTTHYNYDALGNLRGVTLPDGTQITYLIDGQNRRIGKQVNGSLQYGLLYQNQLNPVAMTDAQGNVTERFVYGDKPNVPAYLIKDGTTYRIISDYQGSVRLVVNASTGEIAQQLDYDAFGQVTQDTAPGFQPFGYAGGLYDPQTRLVRFGARDYDAETGRWTAKDPILFQGGQTNLYGYVMNDPVNLIDLAGMEAAAGAICEAGVVLLSAYNAIGTYVSLNELVNGTNEMYYDQLDRVNNRIENYNYNNLDDLAVLLEMREKLQSKRLEDINEATSNLANPFSGMMEDIVKESGICAAVAVSPFP